MRAPRVAAAGGARAIELLDRYAPSFDRRWPELARVTEDGAFAFAAWPSPAAEAFGALLAPVLEGREPAEHRFADTARRWQVEHEVWVSFASLVATANAHRLAVEVSWLDDGPLLEFRHGDRVLHVFNGVWSSDSTLAVALASDKWKTREYLRRLGVPVAPGVLPALPALLGAAAAEVGYPLALKWRYGSNSVGLAPRVTGPAELADAVELLRDVCPLRDLFVERHVPGRYLRAFVVDGSLLRVSEGCPETVTGDGRTPLGELIDLTARAAASADAERRLAVLLAGQGAHPTRAVPLGVTVQVSPATRGWVGVVPGSADWRLVAAAAERIGAALAPSLLGIDFIVGAGEIVVLEVNAAPGFWFHDDQQGLAGVLNGRLLVRLGVA